MTSTLAGWASADITPNLPCWMCGYAARGSPANAVHDALYARALAFGRTARPFVIVQCDLLEVDDALLQAVRTRVRHADVWVAATHTHSGPQIDGCARERVIEGASAAALQAMDSMRPVTATWASVPVYGVAGNRDHPRTESPIDLDLLCLTHVHGPETAILGSFACHPTVLGASNLSISADLSGAFCRQLSTLLGESVWVGLATGAGGDISTRHTRRGQDFRELERLGSILAESARNALEQRQTIRLADPLVQEYRVLLPTRTPAGQQEVESTQAELSRQRAELLRAGRLNEARTIETSLQGLALSSKPRPDAVRARIGVATLGDVALMAIPGELYSKLGRELRRSREHLLLLGYTNGYIGYIPTRAAYASALDYEVLASCLAPGAGEELVKVATQLLATQPEEMLR